MPEEPKSKPAKMVVGPQLKARRQALRLSLSHIEVHTKIRGKFLTALESGNYDTLPNDVYSRGFVQHYANYLGLDGAAVAADYAKERGGIVAGATKAPKLDRGKRLVFTGPIVTALALLAVISGIVAYLLWQFSALAAPPSLALTSPAPDSAITGSVVDVRGKTTPGADVSVNDSPVLTDPDGNFNEKVALQDGINAIRITAKSKLGKQTVITRNVLARIPKVDAADATVPAAPFDGVAVAVAVKDTTSVVVMVDGKEAWRGTVVAGWSHRFDGKDKVVITTGNAGATGVTVTNKTVAGKKIDSLGGNGEIRRNQEFAKDTVIP